MDYVELPPVPALVSPVDCSGSPVAMFAGSGAVALPVIDPEAAELVRDCEAEIEGGGTGWYYVRQCCGLWVSGWDVRPVAGLSGVVWSMMATGEIDPVF